MRLSLPSAVYHRLTPALRAALAVENCKRGNVVPIFNLFFRGIVKWSCNKEFSKETYPQIAIGFKIRFLLLIQKTETEAFLTSVSESFLGTFFTARSNHWLSRCCWFLFRLLYECDYRAVKKMTIFVDILVGVERKSRVWPVGFISIAVFPVSEDEISEFL